MQAALLSSVKQRALDHLEAVLASPIKGAATFLALDDSLVAALSIYLNGTILKSFGINSWYRLSSSEELTRCLGAREPNDENPRRFLVISRCNRSTVSTCSRLVRGLEQRTKLQGLPRCYLEICFVPRRRTLHMSRLLNDLRGAGLPELNPATDLLRQSPNSGKGGSVSAEFRHVCVTFRDLNLFVFGLDGLLYSAEVPEADRMLRLEGDAHVLNDLLCGVEQLVSFGVLADKATVTGAGVTTPWIAKELQKRLVKASSANSSTGPSAGLDPPARSSQPAVGGGDLMHSDGRTVLSAAGPLRDEALRIDLASKFARQSAKLFGSPNTVTRPAREIPRGFSRGSPGQNSTINQRDTAIYPALSPSIHRLLLQEIQVSGAHRHREATDDGDPQQKKVESVQSLPLPIAKFLEAELRFFDTSQSQPCVDELHERLETPGFKARFPTPFSPDSDLTEDRHRLDRGKVIEPRFPQKKLFEIQNIVVIDRATDWVSPFVTPFTYEALLDLVWGIEGCSTTVAEPSEQPLRLNLGESALFTKIQHLTHRELGPKLHDIAQALQLSYQSGQPQPNSKLSVQELQQLMTDIQQHQGDHKALAQHIQVTGYLINEIVKNPAFFTLLRLEDDIMSGAASFEDACRILGGLASHQYPICEIYRLAILNSRVNTNQIDPSAHAALLRQICRSYGPWEAARWSALEIAGILIPHRSAPKRHSLPGGQVSVLDDWGLNRKVLDSLSGLTTGINSQSSPTTGDPIANVHSGFAPPSVRLVQAMRQSPLRQAWDQIVRTSDPAVIVRESRLSRQPRALPPIDLPPPALLVVFIGGMTRSEASAFRLLEKQLGMAILAVTTGIINYRAFVDQYSPEALLSDRSQPRNEELHTGRGDTGAATYVPPAVHIHSSSSYYNDLQAALA